MHFPRKEEIEEKVEEFTIFCDSTPPLFLVSFSIRGIKILYSYLRK